MPTWTRNVGRFRREQEAAFAQMRDNEPIATEDGVSDSAIERLEKWKHGCKSRSVTIDHANSYGASCWSVSLQSGQRTIVAEEVAFLAGPYPPNVVVVKGEEDDDWPGLAATINAALDRWEKPD